MGDSWLGFLAKTSGKVANATVKVAKATKAVPVVGLFSGAACAAYRGVVKGDFVGAAGELVSGGLSCAPGLGTFASLAVDGLLLVRDLRSTPDETESSSDAGGDRDDQHDDSDSDENTEEDSSSDDVMSLFDELENVIEQIRSLRNASISDRIKCFDRLVNVVRRLIEAGCGVSREIFNHLIIHGGGRQVQLNCWEVADVLDVHGMIIEQLRQHPALTSNPTNCALHFTVTINSQSLNLQLSTGGSGCRTSQGVVYAILCVQCVRENTRNHEFYVGLTRRTVHQRVCTEHARGVANANSTGRTTTRPMYQHSAQHHGGSGFNHVFCVFTLPNVQTTNNGNQNLRKWEMFWQFLLHALEFRGGLGHR